MVKIPIILVFLVIVASLIQGGDVLPVEGQRQPGQKQIGTCVDGTYFSLFCPVFSAAVQLFRGLDPTAWLLNPTGLLQPVNENKQTQPDDIDKVPVPGHCFECEVVVGAEMPFHTASQYRDQHDCTHGHMKSMKAGQHIEGRAVNTGFEGQVQLAVGVPILIGLHHNEQKAQCDSCE